MLPNLSISIRFAIQVSCALLSIVSPSRQVRCPVANMGALTTHNNISRAFVWRSAGIDPSIADPCVWAAHVWVAWNSHVATYADFTLRMEDFVSSENLASRVCERAFNQSYCSRAKHRATGSSLMHAIGLGEVRLNHHHRHHGRCSLANVAAVDFALATKVADMAKQYGYTSGPGCDLSLWHEQSAS